MVLMDFQGGWLFTVKDWIDSKWMAKYGEDLPEMGGMAMQGGQSKQVSAGSEVAAAAGQEAVDLLASAQMRCGGCGSKVRPCSYLSAPLASWAGQCPDAVQMLWLQGKIPL